MVILHVSQSSFDLVKILYTCSFHLLWLIPVPILIVSFCLVDNFLYFHDPALLHLGILVSQVQHYHCLLCYHHSGHECDFAAYSDIVALIITVIISASVIETIATSTAFYPSGAFWITFRISETGERETSVNLSLYIWMHISGTFSLRYSHTFFPELVPRAIRILVCIHGSS